MRSSSVRTGDSASPLAQSSIVFGFCAIAALFFAIVVIWTVMVSSHKDSIQQIRVSESQRQLIFTMRAAAYQRNLALFRMATLQDVFARDAEYLQFKAAAVKFIVARQHLLDGQLASATLENWRRLKPGIQQTESLQNTIVDLITEDNTTAALNLIQNQLIPLQRRVSKELTSMLKSARENTDGKLAKANDIARTQYQLILLLALMATSVGYFIARTVLRRSHQAENVLLVKNQQIRAFNAITSAPDKTLEEQISDILQLGCRFLSMKYGFLIRAQSGSAATVINHCCVENQEGFLPQQATVEKLAATSEKITDSPTTLDSLTALDPHLANGLQQQSIATLISVLVENTDNSRVALAFTHDKKISHNNDPEDLIQLISNKLAVLLDQQQTLARLQNAKQAAETANKTKNAFLNHITHKLQSSLSTIIGHSELLQQQMHTNEHSQYLNNLDKIDASSRNLRSLISNLLDLTQLESGSMKFAQQPFDIQSFLEETADNLDTYVSKQIEKLQTTCLNDLGLMVGDPPKIHQIVASLLSFSVNLSAQSKTHLTAWREHGPEDDWLYLEVKISGYGMSKKQINQLFKLATPDLPDQEIYSFSPQLDLAIGKKLCEQMGGDILVDSKPHSSTIFTVCLPCRSQQSNDAMLVITESL